MILYYYPFGLKHKGYNGNVSSLGNSVAQKFKYNSSEYEEVLGLNLYEMDLRSYDPAFARWTSIDPVTHHSMSPYVAFDNNPIFFADPSGADAESFVMDLFNRSSNGEKWTNNNNGTFSSSKGQTAECDDCPQEGQHRTKKVKSVNGLDGTEGVNIVNQYYHTGGLNGSKAGWYSTREYMNIMKPVALELAGQNLIRSGSVEWFNNTDSTDNISFIMGAWAAKLNQIANRKSTGAITPLYFSSPFFAPSAFAKFTQLSKTSKFAFWSGRGTEQAAKTAGYRVIGQTRAGRNLADLTADMAYAPGSQAYNFWGRISTTLAKSVPKGGTANVFLTRRAVSNPTSVWNVFEKPILIQNKVKIKYNWVD